MSFSSPRTMLFSGAMNHINQVLQGALEETQTMITGTRVSVRPVAAPDLRQLRAWEQAPEVARWLATTASALDARESPDQEYERLLRTPRIKLLAIQTEEYGLVGLVRLHDLDLTHRNAQVRLFVASEHQGHGYGGDALCAVVRFCFEELGLHRLGLVVRADHPYAQGLYARLGFRVEGRERDAAWSEGHWVDFVRMGLLANEWPSRMDPSHPADLPAHQSEHQDERALSRGEDE